MYWVIHRYKNSIKKFDIVIFIRQLATLLDAGIPIIKALEMLVSNQKKFACKVLILAIRQELLSGKSFYKAVSSQNKFFDVWICELINIGEHTGKLNTILTNIATHLEKQWQLKKRLQAILFYPLLIVFVALCVTLFLLLFIVPQFQNLFAEIKTELPLITQIIFFIADFLKILCLPLLLFLIAAIYFGLKINNKKRILNYILYRLPLFNVYQEKVNLVQWAKMLALTLTAGLPITQALTLTANFNREGEKHNTYHIQQQLLQGESLHRSLNDVGKFPPLVVQMVRVGEDAGQLEVMLTKIAEFYESEAELALNFFCQILDPLIMLGLGALIGGLLIGIYLPIFRLGTLM